MADDTEIGLNTTIPTLPPLSGAAPLVHRTWLVRVMAKIGRLQVQGQLWWWTQLRSPSDVGQGQKIC
jgi:hypothetical protein